MKLRTSDTLRRPATAADVTEAFATVSSAREVHGTCFGYLGPILVGQLASLRDVEQFYTEAEAATPAKIRVSSTDDDESNHRKSQRTARCRFGL